MKWQKIGEKVLHKFPDAIHLLSGTSKGLAFLLDKWRIQVVCNSFSQSANHLTTGSFQWEALLVCASWQRCGNDLETYSSCVTPYNERLWVTMMQKVSTGFHAKRAMTSLWLQDVGYSSQGYGWSVLNSYNRVSLCRQQLVCPAVVSSQNTPISSVIICNTIVRCWAEQEKNQHSLLQTVYETDN